MKTFLLLIAALLSFSQTCAADNYTYDALNRLTRVIYDNGQSVDYTYDAGANLLMTGSNTLTTPAAFAFTPQTGVALSTLVISNAIVVSGVNAAPNITIVGGEYSVNGAAYTTLPGNVINGDAVTVQLTSSGSYSAAVATTLSIGGVSGTFNVTTQGPPVNQTISSISLTPAFLSVGSSSTASATSTSGLAVSFSSLTQGICSVNGNIVTGLALGVCTIAADQSGSANFLAAAQFTQSITVTAAVTVNGVRSDFDGDAKSDIFWRDQSTGANALWFMNGTSLGLGGIYLQRGRTLGGGRRG